MGVGKGLLSIFSGSVAGQIITFLLLPVLSRLYTPDDFGYLTFALTLSGIAMPVMLLRLDVAILLPKTKREVSAIIWNLAFVILLVMILMGSLIAVAAHLGLLDTTAMPFLFMWGPITAGAAAIVTIVSQLATREQMYGALGRRNFLQSSAINIFQLLFSFVPTVREFGLLLGNLMGAGAGTVSLMRRVRSYFLKVEKYELRNVWVRYRKFPLIFAPTNVINILGFQVPLLFVTMWFGVFEAGILGMTERIATIPLSLIGMSVASVFDAEVAKFIREKAIGLYQFYLKSSVFLFGTGVAAFLGFSFLGDWLVSILFQAEWDNVGAALIPVALSATFKILANPTKRILMLLEKTALAVTLDAVRVLSMLTAVIIVIQLNLGFVECLWVLFSVLAVTDLIIWIAGLFVAHAHDRKIV